MTQRNLAPHTRSKPLARFTLGLVVMGLMGLMGLSLGACGAPPSASPELGIKFSAQIKASDLELVRSFRVMAFAQSTYQCDPKTNTVYYGTSGYTSRITFDWTPAAGLAPTVQLFLPKDATGKQWIIQIEAYTVSRASQSGEKPIATGCTPNVQMFDERPVSATVELHSVR